ncbi:hypothetical protein, partial [Vibrio parahaemolyticus]|uniref:hypothetical protein n=1 Tax=Vibrio parahaemolyticus TaxID=670 RepID=UPI0025AF2A7C
VFWSVCLSVWSACLSVRLRLSVCVFGWCLRCYVCVFVVCCIYVDCPLLCVCLDCVFVFVLFVLQF